MRFFVLRRLRLLLAALALAATVPGCSFVAARKDRAETLRAPDGSFRLDAKHLPFGTESGANHTETGSLYRLHEADGDVSELHTEANAQGAVSLRPLLEQYAGRRLKVEELESAEAFDAVPGNSGMQVVRGHGSLLESGEERVFAVMACTARGRLFVFYREEKKLEGGRRMARQPEEIRLHLAGFARRFRWLKG